MKRDVLHVMYVAFCVFMSVFLVVLYAQSRVVASPRTPGVVAPTAVYRTTYLVEYKYLPTWEKFPVVACRTPEEKI